MVIELGGVQFGLKSYAWFQNRTSAQRKFDLKSQVSDFRPKLHDPKFNYHFIRSILKSHDLWPKILDFGVLNIPSRTNSGTGTGNALTSYLVCKTMWDKNSSITSKQAVLKKWERKEHLSCIKVWFSSPESMMENLPFSCGWGWDVSLSLEKEYVGAAGAILRWISFELWNFLDCTMGSCGEFSLLKLYRSMALSTSLRDSSPLVKFLPRRLFQDIFFKMAASGLAPASEDVRSFTVLLSGSKDYVCLFRATEVRSCNYREPGNMYLLEMTMNLLLCFVCLCFTGLGIIRILSRCWIKKRQNIRQNGHWMLDTSCKVGLQPEGASSLSFRNCNQLKL